MWQAEMVKKLNAAKNGDKQQVIDSYMMLTGKSCQTLYRIAKRHGYLAGRGERRDKGACRLTDEQVQFVSALVQTTAREVKGCILPATEALQIAVDNGVIAAGDISESSLQRILRARAMNKAAIDADDPCIRMASLHPNHVHVFDASICIQYYLKTGGLALLDERDFREKKPANFSKLKKRLFRLILADHFSHYLYVQYYETSGENAAMTFDFLTCAWRGSGHEKLPFRGVPRYLLMDAGSANVAKGILSLLERLGIEIPKNMPHNPRRQGSAEVAQNIIETHFEARLRLEPATTIEELNAWKDDWLARWNATRRHRRHGMTRTACWLTIKHNQLRDLPPAEILQDLYAEPEVQRTVKPDNTISFRSRQYRLSHVPGIAPGDTVNVILRPYHWPEVAVVYRDVAYLVAPVETMAGGFAADAAVIGEQYKSQPYTAAKRARLANENLAYGEERKKGDLPFGGSLRVFGHHAEHVRADYMPRLGVPVVVAGADVADKMIPLMIFFKKLRSVSGTVPVALNTAIRQAYGKSISLAESERLLALAAEHQRLSVADLADGEQEANYAVSNL